MEDQSKRNKKVIVVDDDFTTRKLIADYLEDEGYETYTFGTPEDIGNQITDCGIIIMDVRFGRDRQYAGIDYIIEQIDNRKINPSTTTIIFISRWGRDREGVPGRLQKIDRLYEWLDVSTGLEMTELREILKRSKAP